MKLAPLCKTKKPGTEWCKFQANSVPCGCRLEGLHLRSRQPDYWFGGEFLDVCLHKAKLMPGNWNLNMKSFTVIRSAPQNLAMNTPPKFCKGLIVMGFPHLLKNYRSQDVYMSVKATCSKCLLAVSTVPRPRPYVDTEEWLFQRYSSAQSTMRHLEECEETSSTFASDTNHVVFADQFDSPVRDQCFVMRYLQFACL